MLKTYPLILTIVWLSRGDRDQICQRSLRVGFVAIYTCIAVDAVDITEGSVL
ncbi:hypothetical protein [Kamptonema sp. UHCC 0994]|uniref:hypothetical protein n=1 Tax=Kamptonema sp. UHCC 0994 TaxID=3031329 RepID=UPI0023B9B7DD|nr:hypothetical protein [Kamptonema sp. UHCC 0994]MDF0554109.1 hypothetical protein [Kamptonema sp. UHCC 0994]